MIKLKNLTLLRGTKRVLNQANVTLNPGEKIGLVGHNGAGKSSLFALLTGHLSADSGDLEIPPSWLIAQVAQEMPETSQDATSFVVSGDTILMAAQKELAQAELSGDGNAIGTAHQHIAEANGFDASARAQAMLMGLGFKIAELDKPVNSFSGGWRMRLQLARALMCPSDLLLLDEPTNHLDLDALVWLESWLQRHQGTLITISHDRDFLDAITQVTLHLEDEQLPRYTGGYSAFEELRAQRMVLQQASYEKQQDRIAHLQKFIDRFKAKATKAKQAQSRVKALERMERVAPILTASSFEFEFKEPGNLPNPMLIMDDVACGYGNTPIVRHVKCSVMGGQRIGILGANGQGKSTLVKTIAQQIPALSGSYTQGKGLSIGYFAQQELDVLREHDTPLQHMVRLATMVSPQAREQELRSFLGSFRFVNDMVKQPVGTMSGGEKSRLVLAMLVWQRPNLLLLDEPTNHLDLTTREALAVALNEFEGSVMLVSHDRAMLRSVCDEFWLVADGELKPFDGDLTDYQRYLMDYAKQQREALKKSQASPTSAATLPKLEIAPEKPSSNTSSSKEDRKIAAQRRQQVAEKTKPLKKEISALETRMAEIVKLTTLLESELTQPDLAAPRIVEVSKQLKQLSNEQQAAEELWLDLSQEVHTLENLS